MKTFKRFNTLILIQTLILAAFNCNAQNQRDTLTYYIETEDCQLLPYNFS